MIDKSFIYKMAMPLFESIDGFDIEMMRPWAEHRRHVDARAITRASASRPLMIRASASRGAS